MKKICKLSFLSKLVFTMGMILLSGVMVMPQPVSAVFNDKEMGFVDWLFESGDQVTLSVKTRSNSRGWVCVDTNINRQRMPYAPSYKWHIDEYTSDGWKKRTESSTFSANGNIDHQCLDRNIMPGRIYRARFDMTTPGPITAWGSYTIRGYQGVGLNN